MIAGIQSKLSELVKFFERNFVEPFEYLGQRLHATCSAIHGRLDIFRAEVSIQHPAKSLGDTLILTASSI